MKDFRHVSRNVSRNAGRFPDSLGSLALKNLKPEHKATQRAFTGEMHMDLNKHVVSRANPRIRASLDQCPGALVPWCPGLAAEAGGISRLV